MLAACVTTPSTISGEQQTMPDVTGHEYPSASAPTVSPPIEPEPESQPQLPNATPQVYDRFVLTENGEVFVYVPGVDGEIIPVLLEDKNAVRIRPHYRTDRFKGIPFYNYSTSVQFEDGIIYSYISEFLMAYEHLYGGYGGERLNIPGGAYVGTMWGHNNRIDGMIWLNEYGESSTRGYCLAPNGTLYLNDNSKWIGSYSYTSDLIPIAENVIKAEIGVYVSPIQIHQIYLVDDVFYFSGENEDGAIYEKMDEYEPFIQFYLLFLTGDGELYFYAETDDDIILERVVDNVKNFGVSGLFNLQDPNILFIQKEDGTFFYGRYLDNVNSGYTAETIFSLIQAVVANTPGQYPQKIQWFDVTDSVCIVLDDDGIIAYSDEYPLRFNNIQIESNGLVSASIFYQGATDTEPPLSRYLLALYEDGETLLRKIN